MQKEFFFLFMSLLFPVRASIKVIAEEGDGGGGDEARREKQSRKSL
jgi:hypothetical protein